MKTTTLLFVILGLATSAQMAYAHPVAYQGAVGVMTWNQPFLSDYWVTYSFRSDAAMAVRSMRMSMSGGTFRVYAPQFDYLIHRWNESDSQANIYAYGAFGGVTYQGSTGSTPLGGIEADWESRKYFVLGKVEGMLPTIGPNFYHSEARVGIAPYEAEFNELATWFMIAAQHHPALDKTYAITPLVRLFYRNFLLETGASFDGDWMINFMFHF